MRDAYKSKLLGDLDPSSFIEEIYFSCYGPKVPFWSSPWNILFGGTVLPSPNATTGETRRKNLKIPFRIAAAVAGGSEGHRLIAHFRLLCLLYIYRICSDSNSGSCYSVGKLVTRGMSMPFSLKIVFASELQISRAFGWN